MINRISFMAVVTGVRVKTDYAILVADDNGGKAAALKKRAIEVGGMIELLEMSSEPHQASSNWRKKQKNGYFSNRSKRDNAGVG